jgi:outer membrane protein assembly factor BamB
MGGSTRPATTARWWRWTRINGQRLWETATQATDFRRRGREPERHGVVRHGQGAGGGACARRTARKPGAPTVSSEVLAPPRAASGDLVVVRSNDGKFTGLDARSLGSGAGYIPHIVPALSLRGSAPPVVVGKNLVVAGLDTGKLLVLSLDRGIASHREDHRAAARTHRDRAVDRHRLRTQGCSATRCIWSAYRGSVAAIDMRDGNPVWNSQRCPATPGSTWMPGRFTSATILTRCWHWTARDGGTLWQQSELSGRRLSAPAATENDYVVVGDFEGYLHWLEQGASGPDRRPGSRRRARAISRPTRRGGQHRVRVRSITARSGAFRAGG